ncbi:hypothetical protein HRW23_35015 [Streptomyces lunaelactis]|uniref:hypothetical protein n=1 Tax=Streptomyces lunaelactis TaxID=1535768 RepID=UPI0015844DDE|nr:hypothetical protein [Streptomyces lunaelactis]NUK03345.1 hypothetical protein [Streptomyces lunaelactis]NUK18148.1 hypothetical protein [Streptomyces lunaelactis]NUK25430.1 hypothetical protein [Streptomyces lunaelactis]NUK53123.1 hypothetical protein [Streptomyces lunaelactis]NUK60112.1 hypothetical protein [Streptomyces lunaelactis]
MDPQHRLLIDLATARRAVFHHVGILVRSSAVPEVSTTSLGIMLRIADTRTGRIVEIPSAHRHLLRICVHLPVIDTGIGAVHLRAPLTGDVLARTVELHGLQSLTVLTVPDLPHEQAQALDRAMALLGIHPPATVGVHDVTEALCTAADVHLLAHGAPGRDAVGGVWIDVGQVSPAPPDGGVPDRGHLLASGLLDAFAPAGTDPLAVRMLLLGHDLRTPVTVTSTELAEARRMLRHWREQVADWAQEPSRPIPADVLRQAHAALADDLGVPAVLEMLDGMATRADVPAGAKFETFAFLDRVLGLDLARQVGHQPWATP